MPSATGGSSWFSIPPKGLSRLRTAGPCAGLPSCIKSLTTPLFHEPPLRRWESRHISRVTSRYARYRAISATRADTGKPAVGRWAVRVWDRYRDRVAGIPSARDPNFVRGMDKGREALTGEKD